jgi:hypothetical protein
MRMPGGSDVQWTKNGQPIAGAVATALTLPFVTPADSALYRVTPYAPFPSTYPGIQLEVVPNGHLANTSCRLSLKPGSDLQIFGFVVTGTTRKKLLIRAVGPSLAAYGVVGAAVLPRIRIVDAKGDTYGPQQKGAIDWPSLFASAGAFPLTAGERLGVMCDAQVFVPGAYSVHITDDSNLGGTVLIEVYELP